MFDPPGKSCSQASAIAAGAIHVTKHKVAASCISALGELRRTTSIALLLGEQNVTFALPHADRVYVLDHGRVTWEGTPTRFASEMGVGYL